MIQTPFGMYLKRLDRYCVKKLPSDTKINIDGTNATIWITESYFKDNNFKSFIKNNNDDMDLITEQIINEARNSKRARNRKKSIDKFNYKHYPPTIRKMLDRLNKLEPWDTIFTWNKFDANLIIYYKLKQKGLENVKLNSNAKHVWVEFEFLDDIYIFDISAVFNSDLYGLAVKPKKSAEPIYKYLSRFYTTVQDYIEQNPNVSLDDSEARIEASEDRKLSDVITVFYNTD